MFPKGKKTEYYLKVFSKLDNKQVKTTEIITASDQSRTLRNNATSLLVTFH